MDLFDAAADAAAATGAPLAARMRPRRLDEVAGQRHLIGPGKPLRALIETDALRSVILWGPPGVGKTTLARLIASETERAFETLSAVSAGVKDVRQVIEQARIRLGGEARRTILFLDEIHRFNRAQQDALLPAVEDGLLVLVGATTENPYFEINGPLLSRALLFRLEALDDAEVAAVVERALADARGLGGAFTLAARARAHIVDKANGDARHALSELEVAAALAAAAGRAEITLADAEGAAQARFVAYDKKGDTHYDVISAFIKSLRGSDPDAAVYWLARMLAGGEDPRFIARRMVILASEDVGPADPESLVVAVAAAHALELVGLPEAQLNLAQAAIHLARAPKSNSAAVAIWEAAAAVEGTRTGAVPAHLRDAHYPGARRLGHGEEYLYPHSHPGGHVAQQYLPDNLVGRRFYRPTGQGADLESDSRVIENPEAKEDLDTQFKI
ncbi:MAG: replication-associated recombination protein A [Acidimicrobiia bacterium]